MVCRQTEGYLGKLIPSAINSQSPQCEPVRAAGFFRYVLVKLRWGVLKKWANLALILATFLYASVGAVLVERV